MPEPCIIDHIMITLWNVYGSVIRAFDDFLRFEFEFSQRVGLQRYQNIDIFFISSLLFSKTTTIHDFLQLWNIAECYVMSIWW